ncbi:hypothetical protein FGG08_005350 [Glutinoglossum americanum]|uniref:Uncharacterized protein n=1 Tax=Glutinoglossum americanum TaxID=1670608 RepID=A0A9P8HUP6_9PEZI|nr:hypothetical protein FGG08_005350 [Glutinoglossum americanum]
MDKRGDLESQEGGRFQSIELGDRLGGKNESTENLIKPTKASTLQSKPDVVVWEFQPGSFAERKFEPGSETLQLKDGVTVRLYLVEGTKEPIIKEIMEVPDIGVGKEFFHFHDLNDFTSDHLEFRKCFIKWPRCVEQTPRQWKIEARIAMKRPWDLDNIVDPHELRQDHDRYSDVERVYRPYAPLESRPAESNGSPKAVNPRAKRKKRRNVEKVKETNRNQAAGERIILFDIPPQFAIEDRIYKSSGDSAKPSREPRFEDFQGCRDRFLSALEARVSSGGNIVEAFAGNPIDITRDILLQFVLDDHNEILSKLRAALDYVDESMSDNGILRSHLGDWRVFFGLWRKLLWHDVNAIAYIINNDSLYTSQITTTSSGGHGIHGCKDFKSEFSRLAIDIDTMKTRIDSTFMAIMSTMGIVESQKAIAQAETISKLTNLAFFFIPLTLTAGVFGMNIVEWNSKLKLWNWILASVLVTLFTYTTLYFNEITSALSHGPSYLQNLDPSSPSRVIDYRVMLIRYFFRAYGGAILITTGCVCMLAMMVAGIWAVATRTHLSKDEKASVGFGFAIALPLVLLSWAMIMGGSWKPWRKALLLLGFVVLLGIVALGIWGIFRNPHFSHSKKVSLSVFMAVILPCLYSIVALCCATDEDEYAVVFGLMGCLLFIMILAAIIWAIVTKSPIARSAKIGVSIFITSLFIMIGSFLISLAD